ncbi:MAG TPA: nitroreductase family protein [Gallionella sp.]|nr:nitroreductase family protein [Gallionella sp.]
MALTATEKPQIKNVFEANLSRRSVRTYAPDELDRDTVATLLEAAVRAPTAMHEEPWAFVVLQDHALLQRFSDLVNPIFIEEVRHRNAHGTSHSFDHFTKPDFNIFHGAPVFIIICAKPSSQFVSADCWLAAENLLLASSAIGLGSCVIGSA